MGKKWGLVTGGALIAGALSLLPSRVPQNFQHHSQGQNAGNVDEKRNDIKALVGQEVLDRIPMQDVIDKVALHPERFASDQQDQIEKLREIAAQRIRDIGALAARDKGVCTHYAASDLTEDEYQRIRITRSNDLLELPETRDLRTLAEMNERAIANTLMQQMWQEKYKEDCQPVTAKPQAAPATAASKAAAVKRKSPLPASSRHGGQAAPSNVINCPETGDCNVTIGSTGSAVERQANRMASPPANNR